MELQTRIADGLTAQPALATEPDGNGRLSDLWQEIAICLSRIPLIAEQSLSQVSVTEDLNERVSRLASVSPSESEFLITLFSILSV